MLTIKNPGQVFRSTTPDEHLRIIRDDVTRRSEAVALAERFVAQLVPDGEIWGWRDGAGSFSVYGVAVTSRQLDPIPPGMRWETKGTHGRPVLVPAKRTPEGRELAKQFASLSFAPTHLGAVSGVHLITDGRNSWFASAVIEIVGDQVFATFHHPLDERRHGGKPSDFDKVAGDPDWELEKLSVFYAARELHAKAC